MKPIDAVEADDKIIRTADDIAILCHVGIKSDDENDPVPYKFPSNQQ